MFQDSLLESQGRLASKSRRWITVASVGLQCLVAAVLIVGPMVHPEALSLRTVAPVVLMPVLKKAPLVVQPRMETISRASTAFAMPTVFAATRTAVLPSMRAVDPELATGVTVPLILTGMGGSGNGGPGDSLASGAEPKVMVAVPKKTGPVRVSSGISAGLLLGELRPVYPRIAVAARVEGVVVVEAMISKAGTIESARVVSGPAMLAAAALDAVRVARYRPYLLNGEATEVQTTVTVNFRMGA